LPNCPADKLVAETGYAPRIFAYVDKASRPLFSVVAILIFMPIAYVNCAPPPADPDAPSVSGQVFDWLLALSGLSTLFTWLSICVTHIRFRRAWKVQGHSLEELPFQALGGVYGSFMGAALIVIVLIAQFYVALWPIGGMKETGGEVAETFFKAYLAAPVLLLFYIIGFAWKRTTPKRAHEIDLDTGRKSWLTVEDMRAYRAERRTAPLYVRIYRMLFSSS
jgi:amino acid transporter